VGDFDAATTVRRRDGGRDDATDYDIDLHPGWVIGGKPNGGYLLAALARAACDAVDKPHPLAVSGHYLRAPDAGPASVHVEVLRRGRRVSTARATLFQSGRSCIETLVSAGRLSDDPVDYSAAPPPQLPDPDDCASGERPDFRVELMDHVDLRLDPATVPFDQPHGDPELRGWIRLTDGEAPSVWSLLLAVDAMPPTVFNLGRYGWAPTVELTVLIRGLPAPGWLRVQATTRQVGADGWFDEEATAWDSLGRIVAQSRQLALVGS
jgi:hypothetical protein